LHQIYLGLRNQVFQIFQTEKLYVDLIRSVKGINIKLDYILERILGQNESREIMNNTWACLRQMEVIQSYDQELYQSILELFTCSVEPLVDSIAQGRFIEKGNDGLDFLSQESILEITQTDYSLSVLREMDSNHPLITFRRTFYENGSAMKLFLSNVKDEIYYMNEERRNLTVDYHYLYIKAREERKSRERHERMLQIEKVCQLLLKIGS
jgi:hypothetical protein